MSTAEAEKLTLTQAEFDQQVQDRIERDRKSRGWSDADAEELKGFRKKAKDAEVEDAKKQKDFDKALQLKDEQHAEALKKEKERGDGIFNRYKSERISNAILGAASNAINPSQVSALLRDRVTLDDESNLIVLDANGKPAQGVTVDRLVANFLGENKHFVKASSAGQQNGTAGGGGNSSSDRAVNEGPLAELAKAEEELKAAQESGQLGGGKIVAANAKVLAARKKAKDAGLL